MPDVARVREYHVATPNIGVCEALRVFMGNEVEAGRIVDPDTVKMLATDDGHAVRHKR